MPPGLNAGRRAAQAQACSQSSNHIWVSDELLTSAFHRFAVTCQQHPRRNGSNVPGPLEARKRLARRRLNSVSLHNDGVAPPPPFAPSQAFQLDWLSQLWRRDSGPQWTYQPPAPSSTLPLPSWLEQTAGAESDPGHDWPAPKAEADAATTAKSRDQAMARLQSRVEELNHKIEQCLGRSEKSTADAERVFLGSARNKVHAQVSAQVTEQRVVAENLDGAVDHYVEIRDQIKRKQDEPIEDTRLETYIQIWRWLESGAWRGCPGEAALCRYLLDRAAARKPSVASCHLIKSVLGHSRISRLLRPGPWAGNVFLHLLRLESHRPATQENLRQTLNCYDPALARAWMAAVLTSIETRFDRHLHFLGSFTMLRLLSSLGGLVQSCTYTSPTTHRRLQALRKRVAVSATDVQQLSTISDVEICEVLASLTADPGVPEAIEQDSESAYLGRAPSDVPNGRFQHLAPYFELIWRLREDRLIYRKVMTTILDILLAQDRAEDMAYLAERVHRSLTFSLPIPQESLKMWLDRYSPQYPKTAVRLTKLCITPELQIRDNFVDLIKAQDVTTGALDLLTWREVCKDRLAYMQTMGLADQGSQWRRCLSPNFSKILHAFAIAYAREQRFGHFTRFNRIYRLYKHLKLQQAEVLPIMPKLLALTGVIMPLLDGQRMEGGRVRFVIRVAHVLRPDVPPRQDLMHLGRLDPETRCAHVEQWAEDMYGKGWKTWVGLDGAITAQKPKTSDQNIR